MEEHHTRRALDELAELFLTGPAGGPPAPATSDDNPDANADDHPTPDDADAPTPDHAKPTTAESAEVGSDAPASRTYDASAAMHPLKSMDLTGPAPIRLPPKLKPGVDLDAAWARPDTDHRHTNTNRPAATASPAETATADDPAASHLRLHRDDDGDDHAEQEHGRASVEAVLLGNLPGLSGPWLTQYAQRLAQGNGPVLLLHMDDEGVDVELVEATDRPQAPGRVPPRGQAGDLVDRLETLVRLSPHPVRRVLVHVEAGTQPEVLARLRCLDTWTLLTGADDAATVAGYRLMKSMVEADPAVTPRRVGVMMMGSDDDAACRGIARLRHAASSFLDAPIELVGAQRQMVPVNVRQLGRFEPIAALWPTLRRWLAGLDPAENEAVTPAEPATANQPAAPKQPRTAASNDGQPQPAAASQPEQPEPKPAPAPAAAAPLEREASPQPQPEPEPQQRPATPAQPAASAATATPAAVASPSSQAASETTSASRDSDTPDLAAFLTQDLLAGGVALEARCPHQPDTQLLLDQQGRLHLLRRHHLSQAGQTSARSEADLPALRQAVVELLEARAWVREHVNLLQLTQRQCRIDPAADPAMHLFTHRADLATALVSRLGPMLQLHLLQHVGQDDHATWFSTPLN